MGLMERRGASCDITVDHQKVDQARRHIDRMSTSELCDWTTQVAYDVAQLVDRFREGNDTAVDDMGLAMAMLHACVAEITARSTI